MRRAALILIFIFFYYFFLFFEWSQNARSTQLVVHDDGRDELRGAHVNFGLHLTLA